MSCLTHLYGLGVFAEKFDVEYLKCVNVNMVKKFWGLWVLVLAWHFASAADNGKYTLCQAARSCPFTQGNVYIKKMVADFKKDCGFICPPGYSTWESQGRQICHAGGGGNLDPNSTKTDFVAEYERYGEAYDPQIKKFSTASKILRPTNIIGSLELYTCTLADQNQHISSSDLGTVGGKISGGSFESNIDGTKVELISLEKYYYGGNNPIFCDKKRCIEFANCDNKIPDSCTSGKEYAKSNGDGSYGLATPGEVDSVFKKRLNIKSDYTLDKNNPPAKGKGFEENNPSTVQAPFADVSKSFANNLNTEGVRPEAQNTPTGGGIIVGKNNQNNSTSVTSDADKKAQIEAADKADQEYSKYADQIKNSSLNKANAKPISESNDECAYSDKLTDGKMACNFTRGTIKGAAMANQVSQIGGVMAQQVVSSKATEDAQKANTQSEYMKSAAKMQDSAAKIQQAIGAVNTVLGVAQLGMGMGHSGNEQKIKNEMQGPLRMYGNDQDQQAVLLSDGSSANKYGYVSGQGLSDTAINKWDLNSADSDENSRLLTTVNGNGDKIQIPKWICKSAACKQTPCIAEGGGCELNSNYKKAVEDKMAEAQKRRSQIQKDVKFIKDRSTAEQRAIASDAIGGGMQSLVQGVTQFVQGKMNEENAKLALDNAKNFEKVEGGNPIQTGPGYSYSAPVAVPTTQTQAQAAFDSGFAPEPAQTQAATTEDQKPPENKKLDSVNNIPKLNPGFNPNPDKGDSGIVAPPPGRFVGKPAGQAPGGGGGGAGSSGGGLGGGGGGDNQDQQPSAEMAKNAPASDKYLSAGGTPSGTGGGPTGGSGTGPDLSGLLSQFLPKDKEGDGKNSILDYGDRNPMAATAPDSLLDKNANLFQRVHDTYQDKHRSGSL